MSVGKFHISPCNVRVNKPFGESEQDKNLIEQLRRGEIIEPFKARVEGDGYGVYVGRRRFLAKKTVGAKSFVVGKDFLIRDVSEEDARKASWVENLKFLRDDMDPITRAKGLAEILATSVTGLRGTAAELNIPASTLSEWLSLNDLTPKMQEVTARGEIYYTDALKLVRMKVGRELQNELATVAEKEGLEAFRKAVTRANTGKRKRGLPRETYHILRTTFDKRYKPDLELWDTLNKLAKAEEMELPEYNKHILRLHAKTTLSP